MHQFFIRRFCRVACFGLQSTNYFGSHFPQMIASRCAQKILWIKQIWAHLDYDTRESMARLLGIASSALPISSSSELIGEIISSISGTQKLRVEARSTDCYVLWDMLQQIAC